MSIINEALKKAQIRFQQKESKEKTADKKPGLWIAAVLIFLGFLGCGGVFIFIMASGSQSASSTPKNINTTSDQNSVRQGSVTMFPTPPPSSTQTQNPSGDLVLNGIITMDGNQLALINNQIVKEGDYIGDKRVLSIQADKVEIFDKGQTIVLTTK